MIKRQILTLFLSLLCLPTLSYGQPTAKEREVSKALQSLCTIFDNRIPAIEGRVKLVGVELVGDTLKVELSSAATQLPIREELIEELEGRARKQLGGKINQKTVVRFYSSNLPLEHYIPNLYRHTVEPDSTRYGTVSATPSLTHRPTRGYFCQGLSGRHIALWASHGYVYETRDSMPSWRFQRPALFTTIEDLNTVEYVSGYLAPMLENAGAVTVMPRERSTQIEEIIVDNDQALLGWGKAINRVGHWYTVNGGFREIEVLRDENPHREGTFLMNAGGGEIEFVAVVPQGGYYGVSLAYHSLSISSDRVIAEVRYDGGVEIVEINQRRGGSSWIYLGEWYFEGRASVTIKNVGQGVVTADAVRFGGGMGSVKRGGAVSGMPRWSEAARYYMQYSGVPAQVYRIGEINAIEELLRADSTVADSVELDVTLADTARVDTIELDYVDDYKARGNWVNYLTDSLDVPIDLTLALHSNAGVEQPTFGTLTIFYTGGRQRKLRDSTSRYASRDLADIVHTQIVRTIQEKFTSEWQSRSLLDRPYSEIARPHVPSILLEMFSHQNKADMDFAMEPMFRFQMARAIYVGALKFLAQRYQIPYTVQPLPVRNFNISMKGKDTIELSWLPAIDRIERSAVPTHYVVYTRVGTSSGFDAQGIRVEGECVELPVVRDGKVRSYRVVAVNDGGRSFNSEVLSCGFSADSREKDVEVVINRCQELSAKVPYIWDYGYVGEIYDRDPRSTFVDNENPGYGASYRDKVAVGLAGDDLDNTLTQGVEIVKQGGSYISKGSGKYHWDIW